MLHLRLAFALDRRAQAHDVAGVPMAEHDREAWHRTGDITARCPESLDAELGIEAAKLGDAAVIDAAGQGSVSGSPETFRRIFALAPDLVNAGLDLHCLMGVEVAKVLQFSGLILNDEE